ncbi:MAG: TolC family protein [Pirellulaceae bacterium]|jgi:outer membrane protein TolC|nr:TolC family protein [Pirellulaceae bacterium]MDP7014915.1 TolC family protein [Pirellulaceae bacterium]
MLGIRRECWVGLAILLVGTSGCRSTHDFVFDPSIDHYQAIATEIEFPDVQQEENVRVLESARPASLRNAESLESWSLTLEEVIRTTLTNTEVLRDSGGRVVSAPTGTATVFDAAASDVDPQRGLEAALSAFDAQFSTAIGIAQDEQSFNNRFFGGGATSLISNTGQFSAEISKTAATGTSYAFRNVTNYNRNTSTFNLFSSAYDTFLEAELRHPLLQGGGIEFNRIAGPNATAGNYNGVLIARINTDISLADFEASIRNLLIDIERAYWDLYFAYRDLDAKKARRDATLVTWRIVKDKLAFGDADGEREALAREQYYSAVAAVEQSLSGANGANGVFAVERKLRRLMGLPTHDGRVIKPADEPIRVDMVFDWDEALASSMWRRVELRRQKWTVKRRQLELMAAENFLQMRLDFVGQYRWRGFGDDLLGTTNVVNSGAYADLLTANLQGWQFGLELSTPIGNRKGHAAVRHAELMLAREQALLREQELQVAHELADAFAELDRAYAVARSNYNRAIAAQQQIDPIQAKYEAGDVLLENLLDAQSRAAEANSAFYRSLVDYNLAIATLNFAKGTLLDFHKVRLTEGAWTEEAHNSAQEQARRFRMRGGDCLELPCPVSQGPFAQDPADAEWLPTPDPAEPADAAEEGEPGEPAELDATGPLELLDPPQLGAGPQSAGG